MKIAYLAARNSIHTVRWVNALAARGHTIFLITLHDGNEPLHDKVQLYKLPFSAPHGYFLNIIALRTLLRQLQPDLLHVHYATGYGTLGQLSGFQPLILSVWGSDIFDFPQRSQLHRALLIKNLRAAQQICSTSHVMADATRQLCKDRPIAVTPFGIDTTVFFPRPELRDNTVINIGTVKTLAPKYGIDTLIRVFYELRCQLAKTSSLLAERLRLCIAGEGEQRAELQKLVVQLNLVQVTEFAGHLPHAAVPDYLNKLMVYVAASRYESESFGVAILEASACGLPVVVSRVGGLPEVVMDEITGYVVDKEEIAQFVAVLLKLVQNPLLAEQLGQAGRQRVLDNYAWQDSVTLLETIYAKNLS